MIMRSLYSIIIRAIYFYARSCIIKLIASILSTIHINLTSVTYQTNGHGCIFNNNGLYLFYRILSVQMIFFSRFQTVTIVVCGFLRIQQNIFIPWILSNIEIKEIFFANRSFILIQTNINIALFSVTTAWETMGFLSSSIYLVWQKNIAVACETHS
jgi:hypothetical protein